LRVAIDPAGTKPWVTLNAKPRVIKADGSARAVLRPVARWDVAWSVACVAPQHKIQARRLELRFDWDRPQAIPASVTIDHPDVEDAITSLLDAVPSLLTPRFDTIGIGLR
jgi:hypothetical protein